MSTDRQRWLSALGSMTAGSMSKAEADAKMNAYIPFMAQWPDWVFNPRSLEFVARECKFFPSYAEVSAHLATWLRENRSPQKAIGSDKPAGWNEIDEVWYRYWFRRKSQGFGPIPELQKPPGGLSWRDHVASVVRTYSGKAWSRIVDEGQHMGVGT